jgi:hypothetical protein
MLNLDEILPRRKPRLPSSARGSLKKRTTEHATQTVSTIGTQTEAGATSAPRGGAPAHKHGAKGQHARRALAPDGGEHAPGATAPLASAGGPLGPAAYDSNEDDGPSAREAGPVQPQHSTGRSAGRGSPGGWAQGSSHAGGGHADQADPSHSHGRPSLTPSSSAEQLEQLDSLLHEHQQRLRERVDGVRAEQQRRQKDWLASVADTLPTPQRRAADDSLARPPAPQHGLPAAYGSMPAAYADGSMPARYADQSQAGLGTAPPTPSRVGPTPAVSPQQPLKA